MPGMRLEPGEIVGDYEVIGLLAHGGMGSVYKVRSLISDRVEAMKILLPNLREVPELADRFQREIKVQAKLDHPNITSLRTAFRSNDMLLMVMELVEGTTLEELAKSRRLTVADAIGFASQALDALEYAHSMGVIHRDLKPANMLITPRGVLKLTDFGIAHDAAERRLTRTGATLGSLHYIAPEQINGKQVDLRADIYSLGITLYELLTGSLPFNADSEYGLMTAHIMSSPRPPLELSAGIPAYLSEAVLRSLAKDPTARFQTAREFRNALQGPASQIPVVPTPKQSSRIKWYFLSAAAIVVVGVGAYLLRPTTPFTPVTANPPAHTAQLVVRPDPVKPPPASPAPTSAAKPSISPQQPPPQRKPAPEPLPQPPPPGQKQADTQAILDTVSQFSAAMRTRDLLTIRALWPSIPPQQLQNLRRAFQNNRTFEVIVPPSHQPEITADAATLSALRQQLFHKPGGVFRGSDIALTIHLRRSAGSWLIDFIN
jgi:serine/threonine-protein kinase